MHLLDRHWQRLTWLSAALLPFAGLFALVSASRRIAYRRGWLHATRLPAKIVIVGNISVGGTGKTPLVIWLAEALRARGLTPGLVSRGYRGAGVLTAVAPDADPAAVGDEPALLARRSRCPLWVGPDRAAAARALLERHPDVDVILSDDGLQHYALARDFEIAVVDAGRGLGNGLLLPAGPLREPASRLASVDVIVINGQDPGASGDGKHFGMTLEGAGFLNLLDPGRRCDPADFTGRRVHAVAGIGNPERFFSHLRGLGVFFVAHPFADHHRYTPRDLDFTDADELIMTEKDAIKCAHFARENWWTLPVEAQVDPALADLVVHRLRTSRGHQAA
ncbi:MAG: tetraacyldisaccharide 4'-kinase [Burkholderiales bacterium]